MEHGLSNRKITQQNASFNTLKLHIKPMLKRDRKMQWLNKKKNSLTM